MINKYGNGKAVRPRDRKVLWEINVRPSDKGKPNFVTAPVYYDGKVVFADYQSSMFGHTVYTSSCKTKVTTGLDVRTHKPTFHLEEASYTPMVSDASASS